MTTGTGLNAMLNTLPTDLSTDSVDNPDSGRRVPIMCQNGARQRRGETQ